jgi:hypothetical protein
LVFNVVVLHGPERGQRPGSRHGAMRDQARTVKRGGVGALGASIIVHDVMLCLLIAMTIISLLEMTPRLVTIDAMLVLSQVLVASAVAALVAIVAIGSVVAIVLVIAAMTIVPVITVL